MVTPKLLSSDEFKHLQEEAAMGLSPVEAALLLAHIVALNAEVEATRKERDEHEAMGNKTLAELRARQRDVDEARAQRDVALADNAALLNALGLMHDDVAEGALSFEKREALRFKLLEVMDVPHPGTALLEEHRKAAETLESCREHVRQTGEEYRKALVRARNEGRAFGHLEAVQWLRAHHGGVLAPMAADLDAYLWGERGRALKEPEECVDASCAKCRAGEPCR